MLSWPQRLVISLAWLISGCAGAAPPLTLPTTLCSGKASPPSCRDPREAALRLEDPGLEVLFSEAPPAGAQATRVLTVASSSGGSRVVFRAKFRPTTADAGSNSARKELAAHALQDLVLAPTDWVLPPAAFVCIPIDVARRAIEPDSQPTFRGADCVAGVLSWWLEGGRSLEEAHDAGLLRQEWPLDEELFRAVPSYRSSLADLNVLAHVATHGDSHWKQFVLVGERATARMWLVDNSMAFDGYRNRNFVDGPWDWSNLHVPAVRRDTVARLRRVVDEGSLERLAVVAQRRIEGGRLVAVPPQPATDHRNLGVRWVDGELQVGLTRSEITRLRRRARQLVRKLDAGTLQTF